jgi:tetratricopeptide (TPR) repeat protein
MRIPFRVSTSSKGLVAVGAILGALGLVLAFLIVWSLTQPVISCAPVPGARSWPPASLITAEDYFFQGDYEFDQGNCSAAIAAYSRAIELNPDDAEAYNNRAYTYMVEQNYAAALPDLDRAIELRPDYVNALMNRGDIYNYYYAIDRARALADYDRVLQISGDHRFVCGHRLMALHNGWNWGMIQDLITRGPESGCTIADPVQ